MSYQVQTNWWIPCMLSTAVPLKQEERQSKIITKRYDKADVLRSSV